MTRHAAFLLVLLLATACSRGHAHYQARGVVRDVQVELGQVVIAHDDIPGLMPAMTMNFDVPDPALLSGFEKGQVIEFTLEFTGTAYRVIEVSVLGTQEGGEGGDLSHLVPEREAAPGFELSDQDGNPVSLAGLRGKTLLLDFIFTDCPGPCPILTSTHVRVQRELAEDLRDAVWFVSISLDPIRDTPTALRRYAEQRGANLARWSFLTGSPDVVEDVVRRYGVGSTRDEDGQIDHMVVTFLIDGDGRIAERYLGLEHGADELLRDIQRVVSG